MPFRKRARITLTNIADDDMTLYYQINYTLDRRAGRRAYFHAQFRRSNPAAVQARSIRILDGVKGQGHYVGTYMAWGVNNTGWWGEGEIKFFMDGDGEFPTICGTGTEDYFCGAYNFENKADHSSTTEFTHALCRPAQVMRPDGLYALAEALRHVPLAHHRPDPLHAGSACHDPGARLAQRSGRYLPLQDDIASVAYWYQTLPTAPFPDLPDRDYLEVI